MTAIAATTSAIPPISGSPPPPWEELTREPRRYGFHATLKAPFRLLPPFTEADLVAELDRFSRSAACVRIGRAHHPRDRTVHCHRSPGGKRRRGAAGRGLRDSVRPISPSADTAGAGQARCRGRGRSPDRKPRPLGLPVRVRGLSLSHDADRRDRCEPPWPDHRASAGCLRASRRKADRSRSPNSSWRARTPRPPGFALCARRSWQRRRHVDSASPAATRTDIEPVESSPAPLRIHPAVISG